VRVVPLSCAIKPPPLERPAPPFANTLEGGGAGGGGGRGGGGGGGGRGCGASIVACVGFFWGGVGLCVGLCVGCSCWLQQAGNDARASTPPRARLPAWLLSCRRLESVLGVAGVGGQV